MLLPFIKGKLNETFNRLMMSDMLQAGAQILCTPARICAV